MSQFPNGFSLGDHLDERIEGAEYWEGRLERQEDWEIWTQDAAAFQWASRGYGVERMDARLWRRWTGKKQ